MSEIEAAMRQHSRQSEVQQVMQQVFTHLKPMFSVGYELTLVAAHPNPRHDAVIISTASSREGVMPAALWMQRHILQKIDRIASVSVDGTMTVEKVADAPLVREVQKAAAEVDGKPDLLAVIRGALPLINPKGSSAGLDMLRAALLAHSEAQGEAVS